jgi:hypothetical protein
MAKLYGEIAAKSLLTLDKSFARANGQPLDASEVYYSLEAAKTYAATAQAYIGQKIVVIENGVVSHYSVEDTAGNLKELGSKPVADGTTVAIDADGKITLANIADENKTGTYNAVLVNGKLTWVKPSETTVEGLSDLISALTGRVDTAEADIDALQTAVGVASKPETTEGAGDAVAATGLHKAIEDEIARAQAAEKALGERINGIDFVDTDELATALEPYAKSADVVDKTTYATDKETLENSIATKVDAETYATDKKALEDEDAAIREIAEAAKSSIDTFLNSEEIDETVNTLKEVQAEIAKMTDATELATALASKADVSYVDDELAKKQDVITEGTYATPGDVATAKSEAIADAEGKIATAKSEAIADAATAAAGIYATKTQVGELETAIDGRLDVLEAIDHTAYTTNTAFNEYKTTVENTYATQTTLAEVKQTADNASAKVETLEDKVEEITSVGGEPNVIDYIKVNGTILEVEKDAEGKSTKTVNIEVPTKASDLTDDTGFDARITAAQNKADQGVSDAATAQAAANQAQSEVDALETVVGGIQTTVAGHTTSINDHLTRIGALEQADITHATEYSTLNGIVSGHTTAIAGKAEKSEVEAVSSKASANETAIKVINETTLPALETKLQGNIDKKANSADVYTKTEIGTIAEGKTIVDMINDAKTAATYDDTAIKADIKSNTDAIAILNGDINTAGSVAKTAAEAAKTEVATLIGDAPEALDTIHEIAAWIQNDETGAAALATKVGEHSTAIAAINDASTGILATAKKYTDDQISAIPAATAEALGLVKYDDTTIKMNENKQLYVAQVSTDLLVQGNETLVLNGGKATD